MRTLEDFRNILMLCILICFVLASIQILLDNKRGRDVTDRRYQIKIARRYSPILYFSFLFAPASVSWTARICVVILVVLVGEGITYLLTYRHKQNKK